MSGPLRILVLARTVSILGNFAAPVALSFAVLALTSDQEAAARLALVLAAGAVPQLLFLIVGGVAADRGHRRLVAVGGETGAGLAEAASAALLLTHTATVGALAGLAAARGAFSAGGTPAMRALVADLADQTDQIASVNAALSGGRAIATIAGPALGGLLVTSAGPGWALAANAASYVVAAVLLGPLRPRVRSAQPAGGLSQLRNGWHTIAHAAWLWPLMVYGTLFVLLVDAPYQLISPLLSRQHYGGAIALAVSTTAFGVGSVAGSGVAWRIRPRRPLLAYIALYFLEIPLRLAWVLLAPLPFLAVSAGLAGLSFAAASSLWQTVLASRIDPQRLGTVAAADEAGSAVASPLAIALTAPLIAVLGARTIMASGLLWLVVSTTALTVLTLIMGGWRDEDVPQSRAMETHDTALRAHYEQGMERDRLSDGRGDLEFTRTAEIVSRRLRPAPAVVADIGGGPGRYALWLASLGYQVEHRDLMALHVEQLTADAAGVTGIRTAVGDARDLDLPDASVHAVLLLGPLYHLTDRAERVRALRECGRIVRPGGPVFAAAISRWAVRIDGTLRERLYRRYPATAGFIDEIDRTGLFPPLEEGAFTSFCHQPGELREELEEAGLEVTDLVSVEGPAFILGDLDARMADPADRSAVLEVARAIERVPELIGFGPHLVATGIRPWRS